MYAQRSKQLKNFNCLQDIIAVGQIDSKSIGCVASDIVLYLSLIFILGVVIIKFLMAVAFGWFVSWRIGKFPQETYQERMQRSAEVEAWADDIYEPAPTRFRPNVTSTSKTKRSDRKAFLPQASRFTRASPLLSAGTRPVTTYGAPKPGSLYDQKYSNSNLSLSLVSVCHIAERLLALTRRNRMVGQDHLMIR